MGSQRRDAPFGQTVPEQRATKAVGLHVAAAVAVLGAMQQACEPVQFESLAQSSSVEQGAQLPCVQLLPVGEPTEVQHIWGTVHDWFAHENVVEKARPSADAGASETDASCDPESGGGADDGESADASARTKGSPAQAAVSDTALAATQRPNLFAMRLSCTIANLQRLGTWSERSFTFGGARRREAHPSSRARAR